MTAANALPPLIEESSLPEGWAEMRISDYFDSWGGMTPSTTEKSYWDGNVPWVSSKDIKQSRVNGGQESITQKALKETRLRLCPVGSVLVVVRSGILAHTLPIAIADAPLTINQDLKGFWCQEPQLNEWLAVALRALAPKILGENRKDGTTVQSVRYAELCDLAIPVPPVSEQKRIVEKVEQLLARVNAARERLVRVPTILKRFRQAVLAAACSGQLTSNWREQHPGVEPAEILFTQIDAERRQRYEMECRLSVAAGRRKPKHSDSNKQSRKIISELPDIPKTWAYFRLEEICHQVTDGTHKTPEYQSSGVRFLSVKNVRPFLMRDADIKFISEEEYRSINSRCNPEKGDILYTKIGATYGYAAVNRLDYPFSIFVSLALLKPVTPFFSSTFAEIVMNSEVVFNQARERVSGIGTPDLHLIEIRDFRIPLPPMTEQQEIVRRVEALFKLAHAIEKRVATATVRAEKLTQAVLAKAFRGELVPTEAELARREGRSYEPASALLARIRHDREQSKEVSRRAAHQEHRRWPKRTAKRTSGH